MSLLLWLALLVPVQATPSGVKAGPPNPLDLAVLKAPLERVAAAVENALAHVQTLKSDALKLFHWSVIAGAVLLTMLLMHTIHLHGLACSKSNQLSEVKRS